jgi:hypothetical protein
MRGDCGKSMSRLISCDKCITLVRDADNGEDLNGMVRRVYVGKLCTFL